MPLTRSFPIDQGFPTALDLRRLDAGLIVREGILADPTTVAVAGIAFGAGGFNVSARPFVAALKRGGAAYSLGYGVARLANDAAGAAWTIPAAPVSNSRIDLLWIRATDPGSGEATSGTDGPGGAARAVPIFGVTSGTAAAVPVAPALPAGAFLIATVTTPSGAASIAGSTIVQSYGFAQLSGGTVYARTLALLPSVAVEGDAAVVLGAGARYKRVESAWVETSLSLRYFQGAQTLANNAATDLQSNGSRGGFGSAVTDGSNALIIARAGWYDISGTLNFATNSTGARTLEVTVDAANLSPRLAVSFGAVGSATMTVSGVRFLAANAVVRIAGFQSSGGTLSTGHSLSVKLIRGGTAPA